MTGRTTGGGGGVSPQAQSPPTVTLSNLALVETAIAVDIEMLENSLKIFESFLEISFSLRAIKKTKKEFSAFRLLAYSVFSRPN